MNVLEPLTSLSGWVVSGGISTPSSDPLQWGQHCLPHLTLLLPPDLFCCVTHPLSDTPVLHALFSIDKDLLSIRDGLWEFGLPQDGLWESGLPPGWDPH